LLTLLVGFILARTERAIIPIVILESLSLEVNPVNRMAGKGDDKGFAVPE
jgi:hypothetical protein